MFPAMSPRSKALPLQALALLAVGLVACGDEETVFITEDPAIGVEITISSDNIDTGAQLSVKATTTTPAPKDGHIQITWTADDGSFADAHADSTTWTAPDNPGLYMISAVATDGENVGIGTAMIGVDTYLPTDTPSYLGATACATCHAGGSGGDQFTSWSSSAHAGAMEALVERGTDGNPFCQACHTVGFNGLNADAALNNGGYDESAVARLEGVQCENCHGPGSEHPGPNFGSVQTTLAAETCGSCHNGTHHPTFDEWTSSGHNSVIGFAATRASCSKCHNGLEAPTYLDDPLNYTPPSEDYAETAHHTCAVCHDPHGNDNPGNLRNAAVTDVALPNQILVESAGAGRLCMSCHNGRRTEDNVRDMIVDGSGHFGPHHSIQGDMLAGVNANTTNDSLAINPGFPYSTSRHILVEDACVTCHASPNEGDPSAGIANFTGHTFLPTVEACAPCHGALTDFTDVMAKEDFDGDGTTEGLQVEVQGLLDLLKSTIIAASATTEAMNALTADFETAIGDITISTRDQRRAAYNWAYVEFDGSKGVHNATWSIQLLQQSILFLDPLALPKRAHILVDAG